MDHPDDPLARFWTRATRLAQRLAVALGLSAATAIALGIAATDNGFVQIVIFVMATLAFWVPWFLLLSGLSRLFRRGDRPGPDVIEARATPVPEDNSWRRLAAAAPSHSERIGVLQRSIERSRTALGKADLDPDAHDLCVLVDRRLPELIDHELDDLPPDDRDRGRKINELIDLIEQFARECSRKGSGDAGTSRYNAEVLRRRFEDRLSGPF